MPSGSVCLQRLRGSRMSDTPNLDHIRRLFTLVKGAFSPPPGRFRIALALAMGALCHSIFAAAVLSMIGAMFFGLSLGLGRVAWPWAALANAALMAQFPIGHSLLLTARGRGFLTKVIPGGFGGTLSTTTYAIIASLQLLALFVLWTPSGIILWRAEGWVFWLMCAAYASTWLLLAKASFDAGLEVQSGGLGWLSLLQNLKPVFPDMPHTGLFRLIRQPIYVAFALTLWTVPVWTPDQLALAVIYTGYCLMAPKLKERRFTKLYGQRFQEYQARVPYALPRRIFLKEKK
jgi:methanethiol S-methyltransferase